MEQGIPSVSYHLDANDHIICVGENWLQFAQENDAPHLTPAAVVGSSLWTHITDENMRVIYQMLLAEVREHNKPMVFSFRCDASGCRRFMQMHIMPLEDGVVAFKSRLLRTEPRHPMDLLDTNVDRSDEFITICSWCKRIALADEEWVEVEAGVNHLHLLEAHHLPQLTHGMCPTCRIDWDRKVAQFQTKRS